MPKKPEAESILGDILDAALNPNRMTHKQFAQQAGWEVAHHIGAGFRAVRNDARTDDDVTDYCSSEKDAWEAAFEMTPRKRYLVWLQNARLEGFVLDSESDLQYFLLGYSTHPPEKGSIGVSALAADMRDSFQSNDEREVIVQEFEINKDGFGFTVTSMRRMEIVYDDEDADDTTDDPPGSYDDHCSKV